MAVVPISQGPRVRREGLSGARFRPTDVSSIGRAIGEGMQELGRAGMNAAEAADQIEEVDARVEANRLSVEYAEKAREIGNRVKQTLGENASGAAVQGSADLDQLQRDVLGKASRRARGMLEPDLASKSIIQKDSFADHGHIEKVKAFQTTSDARIASVVELADDEDDEGKAMAILGEAGTVIDEQASFFGRGTDWAREEKRKVASGFFRSRALKRVIGPNGSALSAVEYATAHRGSMTADDYNAVVSAYNDNALDEVATAEVYGAPAASATTTTVAEEGEGGETTAARRLDPIAFFNSFTVPHEGTTYVVDSNGAGVKYGINAAHNPGVNVKELTQTAAAKIFTEKYFEKSGADKLPPALAAVHVDTFFLNEKQAARILKASGGDVDRYIELRNQFLNGLAASNPGKFGKYQRGWQRRTNELAQFAARQGGDGSAPGIQVFADTDLTNFKSRTMGRTDIGLALKRKIIGMAEQQRSTLREERSIREGEAADKLQEAANGLGDGFTNVKQLPQDAWLSASPAARAQFTSMAKSNAENKPLSPEMAAEIEFKEVSDPRGYASKEYLEELRRKGVPLSTLRAVAARQGVIAGQLASATPDVVADGSLWTIAKPAFEAAGMLFDTTEETGSKRSKAAEGQKDAQRKGQAITFLRDMATRWAQANPGKKPDDAMIRGWVGYALRHTSHGYGFELSDHEFYDKIDQGQRVRAMRELIKIDPSWRRKPVAEQIRDVVDVVRDNAARGGF